MSDKKPFSDLCKKEFESKRDLLNHLFKCHSLFEWKCYVESSRAFSKKEK